MIRLLYLTTLLIFVSCAAHADYAFILAKDSLCDNQYDSMNYYWYKNIKKSDGAMGLFFLEKNEFKPVGAPLAFGDYKDVGISAHGGSSGTIAKMPSATFAELVHKAHPEPPKSFYFMTCFSAYSPPGGKSAIRHLAAKYPGDPAERTKIGRLSGTIQACRLRRPLSGAEIKTIGEAIYYEGVPTTDKAKEITAELVASWEKDAYPGSTDSFKTYCGKVGTENLVAFVEQVHKKYIAKYIDLINQNTGGSMPYVCGADTSEPICK